MWSKPSKNRTECETVLHIFCTLLGCTLMSPSLGLHTHVSLSWAAHSCLPLLGCTLMSPSLGLHTHVSLSSSSSSSPQWRSKIFVPGASLQTCASTLPQASCLNSLVTSDGVNAGTSVVDVSLLDENDRELSTCIRPLRDIPRNLLPICFLVTVGMRILQSHAPCRLP